MKQIKVVHVANIDVGLKVHLGNYMRYQRDQGYDVFGICPRGRWLTEDTMILDGIPVKIMPFKPYLSPVTDLGTLARLVHYFRKERFDIVHTHSVKPGLLGRLAARMAGVPVIVHTIHGFYFYEGMSSIQYRFFVMVEKLGAACCDSLLSQNREDLETAVREGICPAEKANYLGNGIDLNRFDPNSVPEERVMALRADLGIQQQPVIGFVARLVREKGVCEFAEAAGILAAKGIDAKYLVVGVAQKGRQTSVPLAHLVQTYGIEDRVIHVGYRDDIPELLKLMDVVVLPSHGREGVPRILMESAALGKPVVATRVRGCIEAVEEGKTGLLVPVRDASALADAILTLLRNSERAIEMGHQARQRALTHFDERLFFWRTDVEYRRLLRHALAIDPNRMLRPVPVSTVREAI